VPDAKRLLVIAGPNGSGKSTLTNQLLADGVDLGHYINPDEIALTLDLTGEARSLEAQRLAEEQRRAYLAQGVSFSFETVMSHPSKIEFLREAREAGYRIVLFFVALESPDLNVARVRQRVALGGHDVPEDRIRSRYNNVMALLPKAIKYTDRTVLFDNSYRSYAGGPVQLTAVCEILRKEKGKFAYLGQQGMPLGYTRSTDLPTWVLKALPKEAFMQSGFWRFRRGGRFPSFMEDRARHKKRL
jgi:predicted ABC-type ATPase